MSIIVNKIFLKVFHVYKLVKIINVYSQIGVNRQELFLKDVTLQNTLFGAISNFKEKTFISLLLVIDYMMWQSITFQNFKNNFNALKNCKTWFKLM